MGICINACADTDIDTHTHMCIHRQKEISKKNTEQRWKSAQGAPSVRKKPKCKLAEVTREPFVEALSRLQDAFSIKSA